MKEYPFHALADLFPLIEGQEFTELVKSIKEHGLREPITLLNETILDGRNRYRACKAADIEPRFEEFADDDPYAFVADKNLHRRHLNASQLGMIGARMANLSIGNPNMNRKSAIAVNTAIGVSQDQAASILGVSRDTVTNAKLILAEGTADEIEAVEQGKRGVRAVSDEIRSRNPHDRRQAKAGQPQIRTVKSDNRFKAQQVNAKLWQELRSALISIGHLPKASDMAIIARNVSRGDIVEENLAHAIEWLTEFHTAWNANKKDAA